MGRTKKKARTEGASMPQSVIDEARSKKADVEKVLDEDLYIIRVKNGDEAYCVLNKWIEGLPDDTDLNVSAIFAPPANIVGTALFPGGLAWPILQEANSIINHYAPFDKHTFAAADPPAIGPPLGGPVIPMQVHHAKMALTKLVGRIQNPADPNYPTIVGLGNGSYICTVYIQWANVGQTIHVYK
jgi:hypothetical protein